MHASLARVCLLTPPARPLPCLVTSAVCPEGTQSTGSDATFGVAGCSACPVGTFNQAKSTNATNACVPCRDNAIAAQPGASKCTPCTGNSTANALRTACGECVEADVPARMDARTQRLQPAGLS